jgi:hypothetical protein
MQKIFGALLNSNILYLQSFVKSPFDYAQDDYQDLIDWLLKNN